MITANDRYSGNDRYSEIKGPDHFFHYSGRCLYLECLKAKTNKAHKVKDHSLLVLMSSVFIQKFPWRVKMVDQELLRKPLTKESTPQYQRGF